MAVQRMDNVGIVVEDMDAAIAFFEAIGLELEGRGTFEGPWMERTIGLDGAKCEIGMLRVPGGGGRVELSRFLSPVASDNGANHAPVNTLGYLRVMFAVDDLDGVVARLERLGAKLVDSIVNYENVYKLCYMRADEGFLVGLAQDLAQDLAPAT